MTNRLADETSPYLLQHAGNPVDWYPWGEEAFAKARAEDKPVFLSIGYSACHWCHVMERESFENDEVAALLNREFVSIKVDREERPDVDSIYMQAVQMMTGHGGWPMSVFLTPEGVPFYAGTYFPPEDGRGMPGFKRILTHLADAYRSKRTEILEASEGVRSSLAAGMKVSGQGSEINAGTLDRIANSIASNHDPVNGGFGGAPKFPPSMTLEFFLQVLARGGSQNLEGIVRLTLTKMAEGGIYDQIGGGFHRYSTDAHWLVPHFEKMLYDNALLARVYLHAWQRFGDPLFEKVTREVLSFVEREMTSPDGGFYSTLDADSEGVEGKFYVWSRAEVLELLGAEEGRIFCALYDIGERGNFEGKNIPNLPRARSSVAAELGISEEKLEDLASRGKCHLYGARAKRIWPGRDEKILAGWNGWMLAAFAEAAIATGSPQLLAVTRRNASFLVETMMDGVRLFRSYKDGRRRITGLLEDYAGVSWGLIHAFEATQDRSYLDAARRLVDTVLERFSDEGEGTFFDTPDDHERLIIRPKDLFDNATPAGNSVMIDVLFRLALLFGEENYDRRARRALAALWPLAEKYPAGFGIFLAGAEWSVGKPREIVISTGAEAAEFWRAAGSTYLPHRILVSTTAGNLPVLEGRAAADETIAWVCEGYRCHEPARDVETFRAQLK